MLVRDQMINIASVSADIVRGSISPRYVMVKLLEVRGDSPVDELCRKTPRRATLIEASRGMHKTDHSPPVASPPILRSPGQSPSRWNRGPTGTAVHPNTSTPIVSPSQPKVEHAKTASPRVRPNPSRAVSRGTMKHDPKLSCLLQMEQAISLGVYDPLNVPSLTPKQSKVIVGIGSISNDVNHNSRDNSVDKTPDLSVEDVIRERQREKEKEETITAPHAPLHAPIEASPSHHAYASPHVASPLISRQFQHAHDSKSFAASTESLRKEARERQEVFDAWYRQYYSKEDTTNAEDEENDAEEAEAVRGVGDALAESSLDELERERGVALASNQYEREEEKERELSEMSDFVVAAPLTTASDRDIDVSGHQPMLPPLVAPVTVPEDARNDVPYSWNLRTPRAPNTAPMHPPVSPQDDCERGYLQDRWWHQQRKGKEGQVAGISGEIPPSSALAASALVQKTSWWMGQVREGMPLEDYRKSYKVLRQSQTKLLAMFRSLPNFPEEFDLATHVFSRFSDSLCQRMVTEINEVHAQLEQVTAELHKTQSKLLHSEEEVSRLETNNHNSQLNVESLYVSLKDKGTEIGKLKEEMSSLLETLNKSEMSRGRGGQKELRQQAAAAEEDEGSEEQDKSALPLYRTASPFFEVLDAIEDTLGEFENTAIQRGEVINDYMKDWVDTLTSNIHVTPASSQTDPVTISAYVPPCGEAKLNRRASVRFYPTESRLREYDPNLVFEEFLCSYKVPSLMIGKESTLSNLLGVCGTLLSAKIVADRNADTLKEHRLEFSTFVVDYFLKKYGLRTRAENQLVIFIYSLRTHMDVSARVEAIFHLCSLGDRVLGAQSTETFLDCWSKLHAYSDISFAESECEKVHLPCDAVERAINVVLSSRVRREVLQTCLQHLQQNVVELDVKERRALFSGRSSGYTQNSKFYMLDSVIGHLMNALLEEDHAEKELLSNLFTVADDNGDGVLTFEEFSNMVRRIDSTHSSQEILHLFKEALMRGTGDAILPEHFAEIMQRSGLARNMLISEKSTDLTQDIEAVRSRESSAGFAAQRTPLPTNNP